MCEIKASDAFVVQKLAAWQRCHSCSEFETGLKSLPGDLHHTGEFYVFHWVVLMRKI